MKLVTGITERVALAIKPFVFIAKNSSTDYLLVASATKAIERMIL